MNTQGKTKDIEKKIGAILLDDEPHTGPIDNAWEKVSRRLETVEQVRPLSPLVPLSVTAAVLLLAGLIFHMAFVLPARPRVTNIRGTVKIYDNSRGAWTFPDGESVALKKGDMVKTFRDGSCDIVRKGIYYMRIRPDSELRLDKMPFITGRTGTKFHMRKGDILSYVPKLSPEYSNLRVETLTALVSVVGTDFMVNAPDTGMSTWVSVLSGLVRVEGKDRMGLVDSRSGLKVAAGEKTVVISGKSPEPPSRMLSHELIQMKELFALGGRTQVALLISSSPDRVLELLGTPAVYVSDTSDDPAVMEIGEILNGLEKAISEDTKESYLENIAAFKEFIDNNENVKFGVVLRLFVGSYYAKIGEFEKSVSYFLETAEKKPFSSLASLAKCAAAVITEEHLGDKEKARELYASIIEKYPHSPEAEYSRRVLSQ